MQSLRSHGRFEQLYDETVVAVSHPLSFLRSKVKDSQSTLVLDLSAPTTSAGTYATNNNALKPRSASLHRVVKEGEEGLYSLVFARCFDAGPSGLDASHVSVTNTCMHMFEIDALCSIFLSTPSFLFRISALITITAEIGMFFALMVLANSLHQ